MEHFFLLFSEKDVIFSSENIDFSSEQNVIKFIIKIVFKQDVLIDFKVMLHSACSPLKFSVSNEVKKIVCNLNQILSSGVTDRIKIDIFRYVFQSFSLTCKEHESTAVLQFLIILCHILGIRVNTNDGVNDENFRSAFEVDIAKPTLVSFEIINNLLICFLKLSLNINNVELQTYHKWLQQLIRDLANYQPFYSLVLEIFSTLADIDLKLLEVNLDHIFSKIFVQSRFSEKIFCDSYEKFLRNSLLICGKFQRTVKFITKLLSNIASSTAELPQEVILPSSFSIEFSKIVCTASSQQSLLLMEVLVQYANRSLQATSRNESVTETLLAVTTELLIAFFKEVKIFAPSVSPGTVQSLINKLDVLRDGLRQFGDFLFRDTNFILKNEGVSKLFLTLCYYSGEIQTLIDCYKDSLSESFSSSSPVNDHDWNCSLTLKQWNSLVKFVLKSKLRSVGAVCYKLALQRLRILRLRKGSVTEDTTLRMILSQLTDPMLDAFQHTPPEEIASLMGILPIDQSKPIVKNILEQVLRQEVSSVLLNPKLHESSTFTLNLFSELGPRLCDAVGDEGSSKTAWLLQEYFDDGNNVDTAVLDNLPEKINAMLRNPKKYRKLHRNTDRSFVLRIVKVFHSLPLVHMPNNVRRLGLSFAVGIAVLTSDDDVTASLLLETIHGLLSSDVDASTCFNVGLCIKWLSALSFDDNLSMKIVEALVRGCTNSKFGLSQMGEVINSPESFQHVTPLRLLETQVAVHQELGKCWIRAKKRKSDNDIIGAYRNKLAKVMTERAKELEERGIDEDNYKVLFKIAGLRLNKAVRNNDATDISRFMQNTFTSCFDYAVKCLKTEFDESSVLFLSIILRSVFQIREFVPKTYLLDIWSAAKNHENFNWHLFPANSTDEEFEVILSDLRDVTEKFVSCESSCSSPNYFDIWAAFFEGSSNSKRTACQAQVQEIFHFIRACDLLLPDLPPEKKISLNKFFFFCVSNRKVILTSHMLDSILHVMIQGGGDPGVLGSEDFRRLFALQVEAGAAMTSRDFSWNKNKVHLMYDLFKCLLGRLITKCLGSESDNDDVVVLSACAFSLEKWASLMARRERDFTRVSAYFITTLVSTMASVTVSPAIKIHLINCLNHFLRISDSHTVSYLLRVLKPGYQQVFNSIYDQFKKYHKYSGKI